MADGHSRRGAHFQTPIYRQMDMGCCPRHPLPFMFSCRWGVFLKKSWGIVVPRGGAQCRGTYWMVPLLWFVSRFPWSARTDNKWMTSKVEPLPIIQERRTVANLSGCNFLLPWIRCVHFTSLLSLSYNSISLSTNHDHNLFFYVYICNIPIQPFNIHRHPLTHIQLNFIWEPFKSLNGSSNYHIIFNKQK